MSIFVPEVDGGLTALGLFVIELGVLVDCALGVMGTWGVPPLVFT